LARRAEQAGRHDEAFAHYRQGNDSARQMFAQVGQAFDPHEHCRQVDRLLAAFDRPYFERAGALGSASELPVFIVGMPRSGTTLVEQILASHPQVFGAGELPDIQKLEAALPGILGEPYPACMERLDRATVQALAGGHLQRLAERGGAARRITDKQPSNHLHLGLIRTLFPRARVIHCRREPLDTCLSCYFHHFEAMPFTTSLEWLGVCYRQYQRLMAHWRDVLPGGFLEIRYEDLVADQEAVTRQLVAFCGLEWDERCLAFHENPRAVQTASAVQVRQPI